MKRFTNILLYSVGFLAFFSICLIVLDLAWTGEIFFGTGEIKYLLGASLFLGTLTEIWR